MTSRENAQSYSKKVNYDLSDILARKSRGEPISSEEQERLKAKKCDSDSKGSMCKIPTGTQQPVTAKQVLVRDMIVPVSHEVLAQYKSLSMLDVLNCSGIAAFFDVKVLSTRLISISSWLFAGTNNGNASSHLRTSNDRHNNKLTHHSLCPYNMQYAITTIVTIQILMYNVS